MEWKLADGVIGDVSVCVAVPWSLAAGVVSGGRRAGRLCVATVGCLVAHSVLPGLVGWLSPSIVRPCPAGTVLTPWPLCVHCSHHPPQGDGIPSPSCTCAV